MPFPRTRKWQGTAARRFAEHRLRLQSPASLDHNSLRNSCQGKARTPGAKACVAKSLLELWWTSDRFSLAPGWRFFLMRFLKYHFRFLKPKDRRLQQEGVRQNCPCCRSRHRVAVF